MSTNEREIIADLQAKLAERQAKDGQMQAELEALRKRAYLRRHETLPGRLTQNQIDKAIAQARKDGKRRTLNDGGNLQLQITVPYGWRKGLKGWSLSVSWILK